MARLEKKIKFFGNAKVEVIKKDDVPLFFVNKKIKDINDNISFLKEELAKQEEELLKAEDEKYKLDQQSKGK